MLASGDALLERDAELRAVAAALSTMREGSGGLFVIDGQAGVGKTALLSSVRELAADNGLLTLSARGAELERDFGFGVIRQVFDSVVLRGDLDLETLFAGAARFAAPLLDVELEGATPAPPDDPFAVRHALYWLTANLAAQTPVVLLVDDAHWADAASLGVLVHIANRLDGIAVTLVVACRSEESLEALDALRARSAENGALLRVSPLSEESAAQVIRSLVPDADDALCRSWHLATGGNPFMLKELVRSALAGEARDGDAAAMSPERVTREVAARLARLPGNASALARAVAILGGDVPLKEAAMLCDLDQDEAAAAADALVTAGVLRSAQPLEFLHPLLLGAVYAGIGEATRSTEHAAAARVLDAAGASPERVAAQLLRCHPAGDRWAYERLMVAARLAFGRAAGDAAATYLRRALAEPPPPEVRMDVLLELAMAEASGSDPDAAIQHLREALAGDIEIARRHHAATLAAGLLGHRWRVPEAVELLEGQIEALSERPDLRANAEAALTNVARIDPSMRPRAAPAAERLRELVQRGETTDPAVIGTVATEMAMAAEPADVTADLAGHALAGFSAGGMAGQDWSGWNALRTLVLCGRYDAAHMIFDRALEAARMRGAPLDVGAVFVFRGELYIHTGDLASAELDARSLMELSAAYGWPMGHAFATAWLGEALLEREELDEAESVLTSGAFAEPPAAVRPGYMQAGVWLSRGRVRLLQGRGEEALADMRECGARTLALGNITPIVNDWRAELAQALLGLGESSEARELAAENLALARQVGAPRPLSTALRIMARAEGGRSEVPLLLEAAEVIEDSGAQLERAKVQAALGAAIRRMGDAEGAREPLRKAVDLAHRCGGSAVESFALGELRATGARPRRRLASGAGALTPSERRIAELAAEGQLNREIAEQLFVTTNTVEYHLRNAYRKLGISGRTELASALE